MFDKMIDSDGADGRGRSRYFIVSGLVIATLFFSAVVLSIYAVDLSLGTDEFDLSVMLAPVPLSEPEPPKPVAQQDQSPASHSDTVSRVQNIQRPEESPTQIPDETSVTKSPFLSRPLGKFEIGPTDSVGAGPKGETGTGRTDSPEVGSSSETASDPVAETVKIPDPPPVIKPKPPTGPVSLGVVNGRALSLPKPPYPAAATAVNAQGEVRVQVTIDESGKVVSATAVSGNPLLRRDSERAAMNARFSPTLLSKVPVKVTGMIVYNFKR